MPGASSTRSGRVGIARLRSLGSSFAPAAPGAAADADVGALVYRRSWACDRSCDVDADGGACEKARMRVLAGAVGSSRSASGWRNADDDDRSEADDVLCDDSGGGAVDDLDVRCGMKRSD